MAIQNTKNIPNRITKKKYFYDPSLEKGIPNTVTSMDKDGTSKDYLNVCFCPDNNKLYVLWEDGSSYGVDVICPNTTTKLSSPEATITHNNLESADQRRGALLYCPNIKRILLWTKGNAFSGVVVIDPQTNAIEQTAVSGYRPFGGSVVYNPNDNKLYSVGDSDATGFAGAVSSARAINTGKISYDGSVSGITVEDGLFTFGTYTSAHAIAVNPDKNELHVAGEGEGLVKITKDKNNNNYYETTLMGANPSNAKTVNHLWSTAKTSSFNFGLDWEGVMNDFSIAASNVIYCPYDKNMYWLATRGWGRNLIPFSGPGLVPDERGIYTMIMVMNEHSQSEPQTRRIITEGTYRDMVYCPDNNMIYILGDSGFRMINPADNYSVTPVRDWNYIDPYSSGSSLSLSWPSSDSLNNFSEFCYSPVNNRIYGVGRQGRIIYIDVTT
jgi:hypothetical protein